MLSRIPADSKCLSFDQLAVDSRCVFADQIASLAVCCQCTYTIVEDAVPANVHDVVVDSAGDELCLQRGNVGDGVLVSDGEWVAGSEGE